MLCPKCQKEMQKKFKWNYDSCFPTYECVYICLDCKVKKTLSEFEYVQVID